ncbi:hypothetical protein, partial [Escherichia coli]|uniref:hypothetical protein n=1 Tax=Escherichia coli TaxID=562 RepID=UPI001BDD3098
VDAVSHRHQSRRCDRRRRITRPDHTHHAFLAATLAQMGNSVAATAHAAEVMKREPDRARYEAGLRKAGLPA